MYEPFDQPTLDPRLAWYCPPAQSAIRDSQLVIWPDAKTDYWQRTHYGFQVDNGHFLYLTTPENFTLSTRVRFFPVHQYDQAGLMVRFSSDFWLKTSLEFEPHEPSRLGAVVTNFGYSDWSTQNYTRQANELELRIRRAGADFTVEYKEVEESSPWIQLRVAHLHLPVNAALQAGLYACSPIAGGYHAEFEHLTLE